MKKTILLILFAFALTVNALAQVATPPMTYKGQVKTESTPYINSEYNFSFVPPPNSKPDNAINDETKFIVTYICPLLECAAPGYFALGNIIPLDLPVAEAVKAFQLKSLQDKIAAGLLSGFNAENNATVLSKRYVAYNGRPGVRIDYNFTKGDISFNGAAFQVFIDEKKVLLTFTAVTDDSESEQWINAGEATLRTIKILPKKIPAKVPREGIATRIGSSNNDNPPPPPPARPTVPKRISGGVLNSKATILPQPEYPAAARAVRASGTVNVEVTIDESGNVISANAVSGHPLLRSAAEKAARSARFAPTLLAGKPVSITGIIVYTFVP